MATNADVVSLQQEKVRKQLPEMFETSNFLYAEMERKADVELVSTRDYRIPIVVAYGGDYRTFNPDGGDMGRGSGPITKHYIATYFPIVFALELTNLQMYATAKSEQAVKSAFALVMAKAMQQLQAQEDAGLHCPTPGVIGQATAQATAGGKTVYTMDTALGTQLFKRQMPLCVYSNDLATQRSKSGDATVVTFRADIVDVVGNKITVSETIGAAANDDKLVFSGVTGATPSWKKSIPAFLSTSTTGNLMTLDRAANPEIVSNWIAVNGPLQGIHGMLLLDAIEQRRDDLGDLTAVMHMKQRAAWYKAGIAISEWQRGAKDSMLDIVPKRAKEFQFAGIRAVTDKHQDRTRIDILNMKRWGRAVLKDLDWYTVGGKKVFELRGTSGGIAAGILMYLELHSDWYTDDPGAQGFLTGLSIPTQ